MLSCLRDARPNGSILERSLVLGQVLCPVSITAPDRPLDRDSFAVALRLELSAEPLWDAARGRDPR